MCEDMSDDEMNMSNVSECVFDVSDVSAMHATAMAENGPTDTSPVMGDALLPFQVQEKHSWVIALM